MRYRAEIKANALLYYLKRIITCICATANAARLKSQSAKKIKHVRLTGDYDENLRKILADVGRLTNKEVRFALKAYRASNPDCL